MATQGMFTNLLHPEETRVAAPDSAPSYPGEHTVLKVSPLMVRGNPLLLIACLALIPVLGIGLIALFAWWLMTINTTLRITNKRTILRQGVFSRYASEILHEKVCNIEVYQTLIDRFCRVGRLDISTAGQAAVELTIKRIAEPCRIKETIDRQRFMQNPTNTLEDGSVAAK